jgi:hypothetical protein
MTGRPSSPAIGREGRRAIGGWLLTLAAFEGGFTGAWGGPPVPALDPFHEAARSNEPRTPQPGFT